MSMIAPFGFIGTGYIDLTFRDGIYFAVVTYGQSLALAQGGSPALSTSQPYSNKVESSGSLINLVESSVENVRSGLCNTASYLATTDAHGLKFAAVLGGMSGAAYSAIKKGTTTYTNMIAALNATNTAVIAAGYTMQVAAMCYLHGEADTSNNVPGATYLTYLDELQSDFDADAKAITGQTWDIPLILSQISSHGAWGKDTPLSGYGQYLAAKDITRPNLMVTGPDYHLEHLSADGVHLTNYSYRFTGSYFGRVVHGYSPACNHRSLKWYPNIPATITLSGTTVTVACRAPKPPLVIDTTTIADKGTAKGFEWYDNSDSPPAITAVSVSDSNVTITLASAPTGGECKLRYAWTSSNGTSGSIITNSGSAMGNIRDSDSTLGKAGEYLYNWLIMFEEDVVNSAARPGPPSLSLSAMTATSADIAWTAGDSGASAIIDYQVEYQDVTTSGSWTSSAAHQSSSPYTVTGLTDGHEYNFRVSATNTQGQGAWSNTVTGSNAAPLVTAIKGTQPTYLLGYYKMDEASGNPQDSSGNGRHMTSTYGTGSRTYGITGPVGNAIQFDGAQLSYYATGSNIVATTDSWTMIALIRPTSLATNQVYAGFGHTATTTGKNYSAFRSGSSTSTTDRINQHDNAGLNQIGNGPASSWANNTWAFQVMWFDRSGGTVSTQIYRRTGSGSKTAVNVTNLSSGYAPTAMCAGGVKTNNSSGYLIAGQPVDIQHLAFWNTLLTEAEVSNIFSKI